MTLLCSGAYLPVQAAHSTPPGAAHKITELVDINRASVDELMHVSGMTRVWAERIIRFRPYRAKHDLAENGVLPGSVYIQIKDYIIARRVKP